MKFEELMTNKKFVNSFSKLPKSKRSITNATFGRTVMEDEYGFTIANKPAKVIENNGETSYSFLITRDSTNTNSFENLVIQTDSSNTTKAVIIKYNLTSPITSSGDNSYSFSSNSEITPIVYNNTTVSESSKMIIICYWITTTYCNNDGSGGIGAEHVAGPNCTYKYNRSTYHCTAGDDGTMDDIPSGGGGGSDGGGGGSTTGTGSNYDGSDTSIHGNGSNSLNTAPVLPDVEQMADDPCNKLKNLFNTPKPDIKSTIQNHLQTNIPLNPNGEKAAYLQKLPDGTMGTTVSAPTLTNEVKIRTGGNFYSAIHTHNTSLYPMFSYSDVIVLNDLNNNVQSHNQDMVSFMLVCQDDNGVFQTYAIVFDANELNNSLNYFLNTPRNNGCTQNEVKAEIDELLGEEYAKDNNYERVFIKFMAHTNVSVYKANSTLTNWSKLSLSKGFSNSVELTPCN